MAVARVHVRSWQVAYRTLIPDGYLDALRPEERARRYDFAAADPLKPRTVLAEEAGSILGFITTSHSRDSDLPRHAEVCALYVDPPHWGRGIGRSLMDAARNGFIRGSYREAFLWALNGNVRADRFYRLDGWAPDGTSRTLERGGITLDEIRYQRLLLTP